MGRRVEKKISINGLTTLHHHYLYRGYLQIAALDLMLPVAPVLWLTHWDPSQPIATRPLSICKNGTWHTYNHDLTKNVMELFTTSGELATTYDYTPYGAVTATGIDQPFQWSSEAYDAELALTYYNYRHYNPHDGRWINRDPIAERGGVNLYAFVGNGVNINLDYLGKAYLAKRPLAHTVITSRDGKTYYSILKHIYKSEGLSTQHSHFFFKDGTNIGYFPDGLHEESAQGTKGNIYIKTDDNLDDCTLKKQLRKRRLIHIV